jgi:DNA-binding MarR family transcriptional regulator
MPRRLKLSPLQRDIMVTLGEAGAETIGTVIATVKPSDEVAFTRNVDGLIELGLVRKEETKPAGRLQIELVLTERGKRAFKE